jgi:hypothetical protein
MREYKQRSREEYDAQEKKRGKIGNAVFIIFMVVLGVYLFRDQIPTIGDLSFNESDIGIGHTTVTPTIMFRTADALEYRVTPHIRIQYKLDGINEKEQIEQQVAHTAHMILREFGSNRSVGSIEGIYSIKKDVSEELSKLFNDTTNDYVVKNIIVDKIEFSKYLLDLIHKQREAQAKLQLEKQKVIEAKARLERLKMEKAGLSDAQISNIVVNRELAAALANIKMPIVYVADTQISEKLMEGAIKKHKQ